MLMTYNLYHHLILLPSDSGNIQLHKQGSPTPGLVLVHGLERNRPPGQMSSEQEVLMLLLV